jgi:LysM repeat protein
MGRFNSRFLLFLVISAIVLGTAVFFGINAIRRRSALATVTTPTPGAIGVAIQPLPAEVLVEGMIVTLRGDPSQAIITRREQEQAFFGGLPETQPIPPAGDPILVSPTPETPVVVQATFAPLATATFAPPLVVPTATSAAAPVIFIAYTVQQGDTLYSIGQAQNSAIELMAVHGIDAVDLVPGTVINLPVANPAYCPGRRAYVIRDHDTLSSIGRAFGTTAADLMAINGLASDAIQSTQVICVP